MAFSPATYAKGSFGKVYKVTYGNTHAALKKVPFTVVTIQDIQKEKNIYWSLKHSNVVKLLAEPWLDSQGMWNIPLELIFGKTLEKLMFSSRSYMELTKPVMITIIRGMCEGLTYMHRKNIVHQDLKPDNIMVEYNTYRAVIIDLGLARFQKNGLCFGAEGGNLCYSAPEIFQGKYRDQYSDVWAMGKIIAELLIVPRVRLPPTINTLYVYGAMGLNPYGFPVSRMVDSFVVFRPTMQQILGDIINAGKRWILFSSILGNVGLAI
ncbi:spindle assembly checkpoint kinase-like [Cyprinus carpio]|uniref:Spindle assembly checkpoint kinase-like n=1 Tax=Cyprinus carpio TaxID=7962 RepID=A0A9Q9ZDC0_CYPCA|nr:spindle assembly checkpoint kinase-like [Cyprinus carpio]